MAALLGIYGGDPMRLLETQDDDERAVLAAVVHRAIELDEVRMRQQAVHIINALAKAIR